MILSSPLDSGRCLNSVLERQLRKQSLPMTTEQQKANHVKIIFEIENENGSVEIQSVWAVPVANGYQIDNIPFYAKEIACYEIVSAEPDDDGMLRFTG